MYAQGDDTGSETGLAERSAGLRDYARQHPLRVAILALLTSKRQPERTAEDLCAELPDAPSRVVVEYHLKALRTMGLVNAHEVGASVVYGLAY